MNFLTSTSLETRLETQAVLYPTLRQLVRLLPLDHKRVIQQIRSQAENNPFLLELATFSKVEQRDALMADTLPEWYEPASTFLSMQDHLQGQISALSLSAKQRQALLHLIQWLSPAGYLEGTPEQWVAGTSWHPSELESVVPVLQSLDPPGVGARSLRECLLLQLQDRPQGLAAILVREHLALLADCTGNSLTAQKSRETLLERLKQKQQVLPDTTLLTLQQAICQIQSLEPRPARNFSHCHTATVTPDLTVGKTETGSWTVSLAYDVSQRFYLNQDAIALLEQAKQQQDIQRLEALLQKARCLLTALNQWQDNLLKVGQFLCDRQHTFLSSGNSLDLVPTPQQLVAKTVGLSDATVSRIVRDRYLLIRRQRHQILPLSAFCVPVTVGGRTPQQIQQLLWELIDAESPTQPYSDEQLARLMKLRFNITIARRTVAKYRQGLGVPAACKRHLRS